MTENRREITGPARHRDFIKPRVEGDVPESVPFAATIRCPPHCKRGELSGGDRQADWCLGPRQRDRI